MLKKTRKIGGEVWRYAGLFLSKKRAREVASLDRRNGNLARVFPLKGQKFVVYIRKKKKTKRRK